MADERINLHHLHYFWAVAHEGSLTRSAQRLRVSQSAMSSQIRLLEGSLGEALFDRVGRGLALTEAGRVALAYADEIFATGDDLRKNGIPTGMMSLIETFPFKHSKAAKDFKQKELQHEYETNAEFTRIIDGWISFSLDLEHTAFVEKWNAKQSGQTVPKQPF